MSEETKMNEETKEIANLKQQYAQVCTAIGDLIFKLEDLKTVQTQLAQQYKKTIESEKPAETK